MNQNIIEDERGNLPSASGVERLVNCAGSRAAELACGPMPDSDVADQGSRIHKARETGDVSHLTDEEIQIVNGLEAIEKEAVAKWRTDLEIPAEAEVTCVKEERLWVRDRKMKPVASCKLDVYWVHGTHALTIDYKSGFLPATPSPRNWQLRTAALALYSETPMLETIRVAIAQHRFRSRYDACDYTTGDIEEVEGDLFHALWRAEQPDAERIPGAWCKYCRAKANCPQAAALALLPSVKLGTEYPAGLKGKGLQAEIAARVNLLQPQDLGFIFEKRHIMVGIQEAVQIRLRQMDIQELATINLMLEPNSPTREITDIDGAFNILLRNQLMSVDEFHTCCKLVLGRIEDLTKKRIIDKGLAKTQDEARKYLGTLLSPVITLNTKQPSLVTLENTPAPVVPAEPATQTVMPVELQKNETESPVQQIKKPKRARGTQTGALQRKNPGKAPVQR